MSVSVAMSSAACAQARSVWLSAAGNTRDCIEEAEHESIVATRIIVDAAGDAITKVCTGIMRSRSRDTHRAGLMVAAISGSRGENSLRNGLPKLTPIFVRILNTGHSVV